MRVTQHDADNGAIIRKSFANGITEVRVEGEAEKTGKYYGKSAHFGIQCLTDGYFKKQ